MTHSIRRALDDPGWLRIGRWGGSYRRSLWSRITRYGVELCSGREGDDSYVHLAPKHPLYTAFDELVSRQEYAVQLARPGDYEEALEGRQEFERAVAEGLAPPPTYLG